MAPCCWRWFSFITTDGTLCSCCCTVTWSRTHTSAQSVSQNQANKGSCSKRRCSRSLPHNESAFHTSAPLLVTVAEAGKLYSARPVKRMKNTWDHVTPIHSRSTVGVCDCGDEWRDPQSVIHSQPVSLPANVATYVQLAVQLLQLLCQHKPNYYYYQLNWCRCRWMSKMADMFEHARLQACTSLYRIETRKVGTFNMRLC